MCILNAGYDDTHVEITIFYNNRDPAGPYKRSVSALRTLHVRFNNLAVVETILLGTDYAGVIESDVPIVVQHTRLDSGQSEKALLSTIAYSAAMIRCCWITERRVQGC